MAEKGADVAAVVFGHLFVLLLFYSLYTYNINIHWYIYIIWFNNKGESKTFGKAGVEEIIQRKNKKTIYPPPQKKKTTHTRTYMCIQKKNKTGEEKNNEDIK